MSSAKFSVANETALARWLGVTIGALAVAGLFAFAIAMTRTPAIQLLVSPQAFYTALVSHVTFALTIWLLGGLCVVALVVARLSGSALGGRAVRSSAALAAAGAAMVALSGFLGLGQPYLNDFVPVIDHPLFYAGMALFVASSLVVLLAFLASYPRWQRLTPEAMGVTVAALAVLLALLMLGVTGLRLLDFSGERAVYLRLLFWAPGQAILFADTALMATLWVLLLRQVYGELDFPERAARLAVFAYLPFLFLANWTMLAGDPVTMFGERRWLVNAVGGIGLFIPSLALLLLVARQIWRGGRRPWREPAFAALALSLTLYVVGGAIAGAGFRSDLRVPAHYHGTVGAVTMALMGLLPLLVERRALASRWATLQPYLYGLGVLVMMLGLYWAGSLGAPRKTFGFDWANLPALAALNVMGLGALLAVAGGLVFVLRALAPLWARLRPAVPAAALLQPGMAVERRPG